MRIRPSKVSEAAMLLLKCDACGKVSEAIVYLVCNDDHEECAADVELLEGGAVYRRFKPYTRKEGTEIFRLESACSGDCLLKLDSDTSFSKR